MTFSFDPGGLGSALPWLRFEEQLASAAAQTGIFDRLLSPDFMPHGTCYLWDPAMVWLHVISDGLITLSYFCIPIALIYFVRKRRDLPFHWIFWLFGAFVLGCGATHLMEVCTVWRPAYLLAGVIKALTAVVSLITAAALIPLLPKALALPSPAHLREANRELEVHIAQRARSEEALQISLAASERALAELAQQKFTLAERQAAEQALRESQSQLHSILQSAMDAIITTDEQERILVFNSAAEKMFRCSATEALGQPIAHFIPQRFHAAHSGHIKKFGENGATARAMGALGSQWGLRADGEEFQIEASISYVKSAGKHLFTVILRDISERVQAEEVREHLAAVVDSSDDAIIGKDLNGIITAWNRGAEKIFGFSAAEVMGKPMLMIFPPDRVNEESDILARIARGESVEHFETVRVRKDGAKIDVSVTISPIRDGSGAIVGASKIAHDITLRKQAEEAVQKSLAASEKARKELVDQRFALDQHADVAITDIDGRITYVNQKFCAISKYAREELIGQNHRILNSGRHSKEFFQQMFNTISGGRVWHGEIRNRAKDGSIYWVDATIVPFVGDDGKPRQYLAIRADITERKRAEEQLAKQTEELSRQAQELVRSRQALEAQTRILQLVLDSMGEGLIAADQEGRFLIWNESAKKLLGRGTADLPHDQWSPRYEAFLPDGITPHPTDRLPLVRALNGESVEMELMIKHPERQSRIFLEFTGRPMKDAQGNPCGGVVAFRDITERKAQEQEIRKLNDELEQRVIERTAQLEAANHELEAFTYSVSHDLRAPLRHIAGFSAILLEEFNSQLTPPGQKYLHRIQEGAQRMGQLVDEMLNLARIGRQALELKRTNLNVIVNEVISILRPDANGRPIEWRIATLPTVHCDPILIKQVFQNLLSNALKYSRNRANPIIEVGEIKEKGKSVIFVRDNGVGFSMKYADKLFGVFQRLHRPEEFEGTGVGLATVQRILQKHGGRAWAEAQLHKGATFYFTLDSKMDSGIEEQGQRNKAAAGV